MWPWWKTLRPLLSRAPATSVFRSSFFFFFNDTATTEIYTLSLHDALPISPGTSRRSSRPPPLRRAWARRRGARSEEHTSELQSQSNLVCRLLLEKKKKNIEENITADKPSCNLCTDANDMCTSTKPMQTSGI